MRLQTVFIALISVHLTIAIEPCMTPNNKPGDCKPLDLCPSINAYFTRGITISLNETYFLRKSKCGSHNEQPKVCCPIEKTTNKSHLFPNPDECGLGVQNKILGGVATELDEFPWMALLQYKSWNGRLIFRCGGALINRRYVLTARHCLISGLVSVRLGEHDVTTDPDCTKFRSGYNYCAARVIDIPIEEMIPYTDTSIEQNDIGLVRLSKEVDYSDYVKPVCLPMAPDEPTKSYIGESFVVAGWGSTENNTYNYVKRKVKVPVKPLANCVRAWKSLSEVEFNLHQGQICAGGDKNKDSCYGDSGAPLMGLRRGKDKEMHWNVFGIVSLGPTNPCGQENKPAVYVRVANYIDWIMENVKE